MRSPSGNDQSVREETLPKLIRVVICFCDKEGHVWVQACWNVNHIVRICRFSFFGDSPKCSASTDL